MAENMSYIDNGKIKLGINLDLGGAITYLSKSGSELNMVNSFDFGRQIQMSHYAGPVPFEPNGKKAQEAWVTIGWNPIQAGDCFGHGSKVLDHKKSGNSLYVKCIPMPWPLDNVPGECIYECWITLKGNTAQIKSRMLNNRPDKKQYEARFQELPAIYTNGPWYRVFTYDGDKPFTGDKVTENPVIWWPKHWHATENWAALVDKDGWGLGMYEPTCYNFSAGFAGVPGSGGPKDGPTGYIAPQQDQVIDWNIDTSFQYTLILGTVDEIRGYIYKQRKPAEHPNWVFKNDRHYWAYRNATDAGWPIKGELNIDISKASATINGQLWCWVAAKNPVLYIKAAFSPGQKSASVMWQRRDGQPFSAQTTVSIPVIDDGKYHVYEVHLGANAEYKGLITRLAIMPEPKDVPGRWLKLKSVGFVKPR